MLVLFVIIGLIVSVLSFKKAIQYSKIEAAFNETNTNLPLFFLIKEGCVHCLTYFSIFATIVLVCIVILNGI